MRFLLGICSGVVLLLLLAGEGTRSDAGGVIARGVERAVPWLAERVGRLEPPQAERPADVRSDVEAPTPGAARQAPLRPDAQAQPEPMAALWPDDAPLPEAFGDAYAWWAQNGEEAAPHAAREPVDVPAPVSISSAEEDVALATAVPDAARQTMPASAVAPAVSTQTTAVAAPEEPAASRTASVWIPFHSERSAAGFAQRLARALEHPFDVRREGPGRYQVVFPYDDASRRDEVLARVAMLTGTQQ